MNITHDKSYLGLWGSQRDSGFTREIANKIVFDAYVKDGQECITAFQTIKDWLEENFKMYQYKKDNGVKHGAHELFYWASWDSPDKHFTIDFNEELSFDKRIELLDQILKYIEENYSNVSGQIRLQYKNCMDWELVNEYVSNLEVDYSNVPYDKLISIYDFRFTGGWKYLSEENKNKLVTIEQELLQTLEGKTVFVNGVKGKFKRVGKDIIGFFKLRSKKTYYKYDLSNIRSLEIYV